MTFQGERTFHPGSGNQAAAFENPDCAGAESGLRLATARADMPDYEVTVNGLAKKIATEAERPLLDVIREEFGLTGTKYGCGEGQCRACSVLLDGKAVTSCLIPMRAAAGKKVVTIEGLADGERLHPVQQAFVEESAMQCGYCVPGMVLQTVALLQQTPNPTERQIVDSLNGNLCRCCGYPQMLAAVRRAARGTSHAKRA